MGLAGWGAREQLDATGRIREDSSTAQDPAGT